MQKDSKELGKKVCDKVHMQERTQEKQQSTRQENM